MTTPLWCLLIVAILPYLIAGIGGQLRLRQLGTLDNNHPRIQALQLEGAAARALAAQHNAWEAVTVFGVAVFMTHVVRAEPQACATASLVYLATRLAHPVLYIADLATLRTLVFLVGLASLGRLFWLAANAA